MRAGQKRAPHSPESIAKQQAGRRMNAVILTEEARIERRKLIRREERIRKAVK